MQVRNKKISMFDTPQANDTKSQWHPCFRNVQTYIFFATVNIPLWPLCAYNVTVLYFLSTTTFLFPTNNCTMRSKSFQYRFCIFLFNNLEYLTKLWVRKLIENFNFRKAFGPLWTKTRKLTAHYLLHNNLKRINSKNTCSL